MYSLFVPSFFFLTHKRSVFYLFSCYPQTDAMLKYVRFLNVFLDLVTILITMCKESNTLLDLGNYFPIGIHSVIQMRPL